MDNRNLTMLMDLYEMTMANGIMQSDMRDTITYFDMFFRRVPDAGGYAIMAGIEQLIEYLNNLHFDDGDIEYLKSLNLFCDEFIDYLRDFKFECDVWAVPEGTPIFPNEPIVTVRGPAIQAMLIETMVLLTINHQSLIATKANRIVRAAKGRPVMEFGARRAQGADAAYYGARAAIIGGCSGTSDLKTAKDFGTKAVGTMAHSWVQLFPDEYTAFKTYAENYPDSCMLLVDTYNVLKSGIPNAIKVFDEVVKPAGFRPLGIRIDSGDIAYLSKKAREMLDAAGYPDAKICVSNSLDEYLIRDMDIQGARIDSYGVGERLITASSEAVFGGVYKLVATEQDGVITPKIKISENIAKITVPGVKIPWRLYDKNTGKAIADVITLNYEKIDDSKPYEIFDPTYTWKRKTITDFTARKLQVKIFEKGTQVYESPSVTEIAALREKLVNNLWDEVKRFEKPHTYYVDLSQDLWDQRNELLNKANKNKGRKIMKKILCLVLCIVFVFSLSACSEESDTKGSHSVDVEYYANLGQINDIAYKLGDSVEKTKAALEKTVDDHGESNYFEYPSGEYTIMSDGAIYCCYKTEDESAGLTHVITTADAYGFTLGAVSKEIRDTMSSIGFDAKERDAKSGEIFFLPAGAQMTVLKYTFQNNTLLFVFQENCLAATVISK